MLELTTRQLKMVTEDELISWMYEIYQEPMLERSDIIYEENS